MPNFVDLALGLLTRYNNFLGVCSIIAWFNYLTNFDPKKTLDNLTVWTTYTFISLKIKVCGRYPPADCSKLQSKRIWIGNFTCSNNSWWFWRSFTAVISSQWYRYEQGLSRARWFIKGYCKVSFLGVVALWGDCTFIMADWGS